MTPATITTTTIKITTPSTPPKCLERPMISAAAEITWSSLPPGAQAPTYKVIFQLFNATGSEIGGSPIEVPILYGDPGKSATFNVGSDVSGATFVAGLYQLSTAGVLTLIDISSTSPYDLKLTCPLRPTNPGTGGGTSPPPPPPMTTKAATVTGSTRTYNTPFKPTAHYRYVYAVVERFRKSGGVETFVRTEHIEFADYYPQQAGIPNTPRYQAEVPYFVKVFDPSTIYYVYFMFVNSAGTIVDATEKTLMV